MAVSILVLLANDFSGARGVGQESRPAADITAESSTEDGDGNWTYRLRVSPAAEPRPALRYRLLVPPVDRIRANAATFYYKALSDEGPDWLKLWENDEQMQSWRDMPVEKLPLDEMRKKVRWVEDGDFSVSLRRGAESDFRWEDPIRQLGVRTLLPQAQRMRSIAQGISLVARLQIAEHRPEAAIDTLRLGYAMSRHLGHGPTLVQSLIGIAIAGHLNDQIRTLIAESDSPNLYWALTELASEPVELKQALSYESRFWEFTIHRLPDLEQRTLSAQEALDLLKQLYELRPGMATGPAPPQPAWGPETELAAVLAAAAIAPQAGIYLREQGYTATQIEAMPLLQRALLYRWRQFAEVRDNAFKWYLLPADENTQKVSRSEAESLQLGRTDIGVPFVNALSPVATVYYARLRSQRDVELFVRSRACACIPRSMARGRNR